MNKGLCLLVAGSLAAGCASNPTSSRIEEPKEKITQQSLGEIFSEGTHYTDILRYFFRQIHASRDLMEKIKGLVDYRNLSRFTFNSQVAMSSAYTDIELFISKYYSEWEQTIPESAEYNGLGDRGWYNIAVNSFGLEFFIHNTGGFYALIPNHQTHDLGKTQKAIHDINNKFSEYFEIIPLVVEAKKDEDLPNDPNKLSVSGYFIRPIMPEMVHGDLIWIQDTLRHYGIDVTLSYPNCTSPKVEGWELGDTIDTIWRLSSMRHYWSKERITPSPAIEYLILPPLDWIPPRPD